MLDYTQVMRESNYVAKYTKKYELYIADYTDIVHELYEKIYKRYTKTINFTTKSFSSKKDLHSLHIYLKKIFFVISLSIHFVVGRLKGSTQR